LKNLNFGIIYSQGAASMSALYHIQEETAKNWIDSHKSTYVGFHTWAKEVSNLSVSRGWMQTQDRYSRIRWTLEANSKGGESQGPLGVNFRVQSTSANITKLAEIYTYEYCQENPEVKLLTSAHDKQTCCA
jgi:DNA polymerase I-like protein with 3'-5' exonuclease and polymerase domains